MKPLLAIDEASFNSDLDVLFRNIERFTTEERARQLTTGKGGATGGAFGAVGGGGKGGFTGVCYKCGGAGHMAKDCFAGPKGPGKGKDKGKGKGKGKGQGGGKQQQQQQQQNPSKQYWCDVHKYNATHTTKECYST